MNAIDVYDLKAKTGFRKQTKPVDIFLKNFPTKVVKGQVQNWSSLRQTGVLIVLSFQPEA